jgi:hypothetical protein
MIPLVLHVDKHTWALLSLWKRFEKSHIMLRIPVVEAHEILNMTVIEDILWDTLLSTC